MNKMMLYFFSLVVIILGLIPHTPAGLVQDSVYKYFQTIDFIRAGYADFSIHNHDFLIDPHNRYGIFRPPFAHLIEGKLFMTFPWSWILLNAWMVNSLGFYGIYIIPFMSGFLSILALREVLKQLSLPVKIVNLTLWFYLIGSSLVVYSVWYYEGTLCNLLFYVFLYLEFKYDSITSKNLKSLFVISAILILIFLVTLRTEVYFLALLLFFCINAVPDKINLRNGFVLFLYTIIPSSFYLFTNYQIWSHAEGLRFLVTHSFSLGDRLFRVLDYFFFEKYSFLFYLPTFFLTFRLFTDWKTLINQMIFRVYVGILIFIIVIPVVSPQQQGSDLMPRFYFPIIPILVSIILYCINAYFKHYEKVLTRLLFIQSGLFLFVTIFVYIAFSIRMNSIYNKLIPYIVDSNIVSNEGHGHLIQNAEIRNVYLARRESSLGFLLRDLERLQHKKYHFFIWEPELKNYSQITLNKDFEYVTKVYDILIYKNRK